MDHDAAVSRIAGAIGEAARARMLYCLCDGRGRTSTELAMVAGVSASTASVHLKRLEQQRLVQVHAQGRHRYYNLMGKDVAAVLETLSVLAGSASRFEPSTPHELRAARTCYDHIAGTLGVLLHDRFNALRWLVESPETGRGYELTNDGAKAFERMGIEVEKLRGQRRRFAYPCLDWSERRPHLAGALGGALLDLALNKKWVVRELDSRGLNVTNLGKRELLARLTIGLPRRP